MFPLTLQEIFKYLGFALGGGGLGIAIKYLYELIVFRKQRNADVESIQIDTDAKRVQMADTIIEQFRRTMEEQAAHINSLQTQINVMSRRISTLERRLILNGLPTHDEPD